ncbi:MAG: hypothetical protein AB7P12_10545 [Alphaproteobacteria bacterium]
MKTRPVVACAAAAAMLVLPLALAAPARAQAAGQVAAASPENGTATLTMTFEITGGGDDIPQSHERHVTWNVVDRYTVTATMTAGNPGGFPAMHQPDAGEQAREANRAAAADSAATNMQSMMEQAQKIAEMCGDDEACIEAETMKMAQGIDMNSPEMQAAQADVAAASAMPGPRYQLFMPATQSGTYAVEETAREAYFDAACSLATEERCAYDTAVRGEGATTDAAGATESGTGAMAELDLETGSLMLTLVVPGFGKVTKTVESKNPEIETGTTEETRTVRFDDLPDGPVAVDCGACQSASGSFEREVEDALLGRPAKLVVTWSFTRP